MRPGTVQPAFYRNMVRRSVYPAPLGFYANPGRKTRVTHASLRYHPR